MRWCDTACSSLGLRGRPSLRLAWPGRSGIGHRCAAEARDAGSRSSDHPHDPVDRAGGVADDRDRAQARGDAIASCQPVAQDASGGMALAFPKPVKAKGLGARQRELERCLGEPEAEALRPGDGSFRLLIRQGGSDDSVCRPSCPENPTFSAAQVAGPSIQTKQHPSWERPECLFLGNCSVFGEAIWDRNAQCRSILMSASLAGT